MQYGTYKRITSSILKWNFVGGNWISQSVGKYECNVTKVKDVTANQINGRAPIKNHHVSAAINL